MIPRGWKIRERGWYPSLFENEEFRQAVLDEYYNKGVREALLDGVAEFERQKEIQGQDGALNFLFYGSSNIWGFIPMYGETYDEYCGNMIRFYANRVRWIDQQMTDERPVDEQ